MTDKIKRWNIYVFSSTKGKYNVRNLEKTYLNTALLKATSATPEESNLYENLYGKNKLYA